MEISFYSWSCWEALNGSRFEANKWCIICWDMSSLTERTTRKASCLFWKGPIASNSITWPKSLEKILSNGPCQDGYISHHLSQRYLIWPICLLCQSEYFSTNLDVVLPACYQVSAEAHDENLTIHIQPSNSVSFTSYRSVHRRWSCIRYPC